MTATPFAITYVGLPISSGGAHGLGRLAVREAFERTTGFLQTCTALAKPATCTVLRTNAPDLVPDPQIDARLTSQFGAGPRVQVPWERVDDALKFIESIRDQPVNAWGMAGYWLQVDASFRVLSPTSLIPLPGQSAERYNGVEYQWNTPLGTSALTLSLHKSAALAIDLCIPDTDGDDLRQVVAWLQQHLPIRFSPKHWTRWTPTKSGGYRGRKVPAPAINKPSN